ncbi:hypothetical protein WT83_27080 [Burkholderia territorii]|uniref:Peptidase M41 domain-containing protein n=1 Tax=Burkholderia territorii TaxID=1503055 RepID=A0A108E7X8_9BURK|nr:hypothetical protein [Burkholderia territorii]KWN06350.1 hypothetical protein WT83_27080 [Burkholderia territorii]
MKRESIRDAKRPLPYVLLAYMITMAIAFLIVTVAPRERGTFARYAAITLGFAAAFSMPLVRRYLERLRGRVLTAGGSWPTWPGWRVTGSTIAAWLMRLVVANAVIIGGAALIYAWSKSAPAPASLPEPAATIYGVAWQCGWLWLMIWTVFRCLLAFGDAQRGFLTVMRGMLARIVMLTLASVAICKFSPMLVTLIQEMEARPHATFATAIGLLVVYGVFRFVDRWIDLPVRQYTIARAAIAEVRASVSESRRRQRTESEVRRTAVHEAGHALLYAAMPSLPENFVVKVFWDLGPNDRYRGFVRSAANCQTAQVESVSHWKMLFDLAGTVAEKIVYGVRADGAVEDNTRWTRAAQEYLACGYGEVYFEEPATELEAECNQRALNRLKSAHYEVLETFLDANRALLDELADRLVTDGELDHKGIAPYLAQVTFTQAVRPLPSESIV